MCHARSFWTTLVVTAGLLVTACGSGPSSADGRAPSQVALSTAAPAATVKALPPAAAATCAAARTAILAGTARFTDQVRHVVEAGEEGRMAQQAAHLGRLRAGLARWAAELDAVARQSDDPALAGIVQQYAGAVRAAQDRVRKPADLDNLTTFDDIELDTAADQFARAC